MDWLVILLRILHIGGGTFWVGAAFTFFFFVEPSTRVLKPDGLMGFMGEVNGRRRFPMVVLAVSLITVVAGTILYWRATDGFDADIITTAPGMAFLVGGLAAYVSFFIGLLVIVPTIRRLGETGAAMMAADRPPTPEEEGVVHGLERRLATAGRLDLVGLTIAVVAMATARYLG
ncbi:MAG: hypothetical protein ACXWXJ_12050 [Aeromicrobium sp.]